jgi:hypothetical protein
MFQLRTHQPSECQNLFGLWQATCRNSADTTAAPTAITQVDAAKTIGTAVTARAETTHPVTDRGVANRFDRRDLARAVHVRLDRDFLRGQSVAFGRVTADRRTRLDNADTIRFGSSADSCASNYCPDERAISAIANTYADRGIPAGYIRWSNTQPR